MRGGRGIGRVGSGWEAVGSDQWSGVRGQWSAASEIGISNLGLGLLVTGHWALAAGFWGLTVKIRKALRNVLTCFGIPDRVCCSTDIRSLWVCSELPRPVIPN